MLIRQLKNFKAGMLQVEGVAVDLTALQPLIDRVFVPAQEFTLYSGTGTIAAAGVGATNGSKTPAFSFPNEVTVWSAGLRFLPPHWVTCRLVIVFTQIATLTGNVVLQINAGVFGDTETMSMTVGSNVTTAVPSNFVQKRVELMTGLACNSNKLLGMRVSRQGTDGADTCTGDIYVYGMMLEKVT